VRTTKWKLSVAFLVFTCLFFSKEVYSAHPLLTEDTGTQGKGGWQLEVNGERQRDPQPATEEAPVLRATQSGTTLSYGITETIDFKIDLPYVRHQGILDTGIGFKWRFYEEGPLSFGTLFGVRPHLPTGRLKVLAITAAKRSPAVPDIPTVAEAGVPGYEVDQWYGIITGAKVPMAIVRKLNAAIAEAVKSPEVAKRLVAEGSTPVGSTPEQFSVHIKSEIAKWRKLAKEAKLELQE